MAIDELVVMVVADKDVHRVPHHVDHLGLGDQVRGQEGEGKMGLDEPPLLSGNIVHLLLHVGVTKPRRRLLESEGAPPPKEQHDTPKETE